MSRREESAATVRILAAIAIAIAIAIATAATRPLHAGPGEAGRGRRPARTSAPDLAGADFAVLVWFRVDDPLGTFRYQSYDVREGEYTGAVDDWVGMIRAKYPRYAVRVLPVHLDRERGATEKLKVGSVIHRELLLAAARSGVVLGGPMPVGPGPSAMPHPSPRANVRIEAPGAGGTSPINPVTPMMPFPYPYPRPHP